MAETEGSIIDSSPRQSEAQNDTNMELATIKIILAGEGGQGTQTTAKILSATAAEEGFEVAYIPSFGVEQRGSPSIAFLTISSNEIHYPRFDKADFAVILQERAIPSVAKYVTPETIIIFDSSTVSSKTFRAKKVFGIPATKLASENLTPKSFNVLVIGVLSQLLNLPAEKTWQMTVQTLGKKFKTEEIKEKNHQIFLLGKDFKLEEDNFTEPTFVPQQGAIETKGEGKRAIIIPDHCKSCGICIVKCPFGALSFGKKLGLFSMPIPEIDLKKCTACDICSRFCPDGAISIEKEKLD